MADKIETTRDAILAILQTSMNGKFGISELDDELWRLHKYVHSRIWPKPVDVSGEIQKLIDSGDVVISGGRVCRVVKKKVVLKQRDLFE